MTPRTQGPSARAWIYPASAALLLAACSTRGAPVEVPVDVTVAPLPPDAGGVVRAPPNSSPTTCSARLRAGRIDKSSPGCIIDTQISETAGVLSYPCSGDGSVEAEFGSQRYTGTVVGGEVELTLDTELDWEDGCRWGTRALIKGQLLVNGEPSSKRLNWTYRDMIITGTNCSGSCTARSSFEVIAARKGTGPQTPPENEDDD